MSRNDFLNKIADLLQTDVNLNFETNLNTLQEWDSLSMMSVVAFISKNFTKKITYTEIRSLKTIEDIYIKAND